MIEEFSGDGVTNSLTLGNFCWADDFFATAAQEINIYHIYHEVIW